MAFRQGVSEGMGSASPSLQLRSFTSLFPLVGLYLVSGNACGGFVQRYTITAQIEVVFELEVPPLDELDFFHADLGTGVLR